MATFTSLTIANYGADAIITAETMQAFYDNVEGAFAGLAPYTANQLAIGAGAIGQSQLKTAASSQSISFIGGSAIALTGGAYSFWTAGASDGVSWGFGDTAAGTLGVYTSSVFNVQFYVDSLYIQSSPPYDLGDGEIPLFVYVLVDSNGDIKGHTEAQDPIWVNHGQTNCTPDFYESKGGIITGMMNCYDYPTGVTTEREQARWRRRNPNCLTANPVDKNADMNLVPHPFFKHDSKYTPILIDPVSEFVETLRDAHDAGEDMRDLILNGLSVDNVPLDRGSPSSLIVVSGRIK